MQKNTITGHIKDVPCIHQKGDSMNLLRKLDGLNFPYDTIHMETINHIDVFNKAKKTTFVYNQNSIISKACFKSLGSNFPIEEVTSDDFASLETACFVSCADYLIPLLKLLPSTVTQLYIFSCGLLTFPEELLRFVDLKELTINHTRIKFLPEEIATFNRLERLNVSDNMLTAISGRIGECTNLTSLDISFNGMLDLPDEMKSVTNLTSLYINGIGLKNLPDWMQNFTNLTSLNISGNFLENLPDWMQNVANLASLDLSDNEFENLPDWIQNFVRLTSLDLSENELENLPDWMKNLTRLTSLNISNNYIKNLPDWMQSFTNLTSLNISDNKLENLPDWMQSFTNLTSLNISNNHIKNLPDWMQNFTNLTSLNISNNHIKNLPGGMQGFTNLTSLDISDNDLKSLPDWIQSFTNLTSLDISCNHLEDLPDWIQNLSNLTSLSISEDNYRNNRYRFIEPYHIEISTNVTVNYLSKPLDWMQALTNLTSLDISGYNLNNLPDWIQNLTNLTSLNISANNLVSLPEWIQNFTNLTSIDIRNNELENLPDWMQNLTNLTLLNVKGNHLKNLPEWIKNLTNLRALDCSYNEITELPNCFNNLHSLLWLVISRLDLEIIPHSIVQLTLPFNNQVSLINDGKEVSIYGVTLSKMDISLFEQSHELIEAYYHGEHIPLRECKVIFLGDGEVGKSSLIDRMMFDRFDPNKKSTDGIRIEDWQPDGFEGTLRIWDFGGQEIMHSMHNCFLTSGCVYVIVLSGRENTFIDRKALHWLDVVQSFAPGSDVIIVVNKNDRKPYTSIPIEKLKEKYPDVIYDYFETSARENLNISRLAKSMMECAKQTEGYNYKFNMSMKKVKDSIGETKEYYIHNDVYREMCEHYGIDSQEVQVGLLKYFKTLGVSFYYQDKPGKEKRPSMEGYTILKPDWLTNGIYRLINRAGDNNGIISHKHIYDILNRSHENDVIEGMIYSEKEAEYILFVMRIFKLSYKLDSENEDHEFIPLMCSKDMPPTAKSYKERATLHLSWESEFIPFNALYQVMVRMFGEIDYENTWRYGAVFKPAGSTATVFVEMDIKEERIDIYVKSKSKDEKEVLHRYRNRILYILERLGIKTEEYMHIANSEGKVGKIEYTTVLNRFDQGKEVYIKELNEDFDSAKLFGIYYYIGKVANKPFHIENVIIHHGGQFMPDYRIDAKSAGDGSFFLNAKQGSGDGAVTQQITFNERFPSVTAQQYEELTLFLLEFTQSKAFKGLSWRKRLMLMRIIKDNSHVSGWRKFSKFLNDTANFYVICGLVQTYGPRLPIWLFEVFNAIIT